MFVKLTNANPQFKDQPVILNSQSIVTVFQGTVVREDNEEQTATLVFCPPHGTWEVQETVEEVWQQLAQA
jgi:hypothetical protein